MLRILRYRKLTIYRENSVGISTKFLVNLYLKQIEMCFIIKRTSVCFTYKFLLSLCLLIDTVMFLLPFTKLQGRSESCCSPEKPGQLLGNLSSKSSAPLICITSEFKSTSSKLENMPDQDGNRTYLVNRFDSHRGQAYFSDSLSNPANITNQCSLATACQLILMYRFVPPLSFLQGRKPSTSQRKGQSAPRSREEEANCVCCGVVRDYCGYVRRITGIVRNTRGYI